MNLIIDRFEGEYAVIELPDRSMINLPKKILPAEAREDDIIQVIVNKNETKKREEEIKKLAEDLWE